MTISTLYNHNSSNTNIGTHRPSPYTKFDRKGKIIGEKISKESGVNFPYIPGLLAFRVGPAVCSAIEELVEDVDLLLFDGQGIAHPLGFYNVGVREKIRHSPCCKTF